MPTEPERDIEKALRAYAKKRREDRGAPAEMHPATRRLLQSEVARLRTGKAAGESNFWRRIFGGSWPQVAFNVCVLALVAAAGVFLLLPSLSRGKFGVKRELAAVRPRDLDENHGVRQNSSAPPAKVPVPAEAIVAEGERKEMAKQVQPSGAAVPASAPTEPAGIVMQQPSTRTDMALRLAAPAYDREKDASLATSDAAKKRSLVESAPVAQSTLKSAADAKALSQQTNRRQVAADIPPIVTPPVALAAAPPPASTSVSSGGFVFANANNASAISPAAANESLSDDVDKLKSITNLIMQRFVRSEQSAKLPRRLQSLNRVVLRSFRVEQTGNQIRIIDRDGSVYTGLLGPALDKAQTFDGANGTLTVTPPTVIHNNAFVAGENKAVATNSMNLGSAFKPVQNYFFRVSGTNRSLHQPVVFNGNFVPEDTGSFAGKPSTSNWQAGNETLTPALGLPTWHLLNSRLEGEAVVGGSNQIEIKALPVKR